MATNIVPIMTGLTAPSGVASASSTFDPVDFPAWKAFTHSNSGYDDCWHSASAAPQSIQYQSPLPRVVTSYAVTSRDIADDTRPPKTWTFEGSNDGTDWVTLDTQTDVVDWAITANVRKAFTFTNAVPFVYHRLHVSVGNGAYVAVGELEINAAGTTTYLDCGLTPPAVGINADPYYDSVIVVPDTYDVGRLAPYELVLFCGGAAANVHDLENGVGSYVNLAAHFAAAGYVFVQPFYGASPRNWGSDYAQANVATMLAYAITNYNVDRQAILVGGSMGGLVGLNYFRMVDTAAYRGAALVYPATDLDNISSCEEEIAALYPVTADRNAHNPTHHFSSYTGLRIGIWHATGDAIVPYSGSVAFRAGVRAAGGAVTLATVAGGHDQTATDEFLTEVDAYLATLPDSGAADGPGGFNELILAATSAVKLKTDTIGGTGAIAWPYTLTTDGTTAIPDAEVWVTSDEGGATVIASGRTNAFGAMMPVPHLDAGTYYFWAQKSGFNFTNPDTEVVA